MVRPRDSLLNNNKTVKITTLSLHIGYRTWQCRKKLWTEYLHWSIR